MQLRMPKSILSMLFLSLSVAANGQNLVSNGDFEAGLAGWTTWAATPSGFWNGVWLQSNDCDIWIPTNGCPYEGTTSFSQKKGSGAGNAHGGVYQVLNVEVGRTYDVSGFWSGGVTGNTAGNGTWWELTIYDGVADAATIDAAPGPDDVIIDKIEQNGLAQNGVYQFQWQAFGGSFEAQSTQVTLAFKNGSFYTFEAAGYLDQVEVIEQQGPGPDSDTALPVPALGLWGLLLLIVSMPLVVRFRGGDR